MLGRLSTGPRAGEFPELSAAFRSGSNMEKRKVLQDFLNNGSNLQATESFFKPKRTIETSKRGGREQLTIKDMRDRGFTEILVFMYFSGCFLHQISTREFNPILAQEFGRNGSGPRLLQ